MTRASRKDVSLAVAQLMPYIMRGVQFDFFVRRGVTQTQFLLLASIHAYTRCTMGTLARNLHVSMPTVSGIVDRLVRAGYLRRVPRPDDRRQVAVELTAKGRAFFQDFQTVVRRRWEEGSATRPRRSTSRLVRFRLVHSSGWPKGASPGRASVYSAS
jgi:DNA-binding MarR family transcriptional regulator